MNKAIKARWLEALRSGTYNQGTGALRNNDGEFCCLGVLCDLAEKDAIVESRAIRDENAEGTVIELSTAYGTAEEHDEEASSDAYLPVSVREWAGLDSGDPYLRFDTSASRLNDNGSTFAEIADLIEQHL